MCRTSLYIFVLLYFCNIHRGASFTVNKAEVEFTNRNSSERADTDKTNYISEDSTTRRNKVRHSRYPKLHDLFDQIASLDSLIPINLDPEDDEEDEEPENVEQEKPPTVNVAPEQKSTARDLIEDVTKNEKSEERDLEDIEYEEYDDVDYEDEDEELAIFKTLLNLEDSKSQKLSEVVDGYLSANQWNISDKQNMRKETPNDEDVDDFEDWDYNQEDQGSQPSAQEARRPSSTRRWKQHSTRLQFDRSRLYQPIKEDDHLEALLHRNLVRLEGACHKPLQRVVSIQSLYPHVSKRYIPHCTILHHCGDDTGCCKSDALTCAARTYKRIERKFFTITIHDGHVIRQVEKLAFYNHTECECTSKENEYLKDDGTTSMPIFRNIPAQDNPASTASTETEEPMALKKCKCPSEFSPQLKDGGECICDCITRQKDCARFKRGKEYFGINDRQCIFNDECQKPTCEFGSYMLKKGRCPRKQEKN